MPNQTSSSRLASTLQTRMKDLISAGSSISVELGRIDANGLRVDSFPKIIPKGSYMIADNLTKCETCTACPEHFPGKEGACGKKKKLTPGTRVLVVWAGDEAVVVDIVKSS